MNTATRLLLARFLACAASLALAGTYTAAAAPTTGPGSEAAMAHAADQAFEAGDWKAALPLYEQLVQAQPDSARLVYRLALAQQRAGMHERALATLGESQRLGFPQANVEYGIATVHASLGHADEAFAHLAEAARQGWSETDTLDASRDFAPLRADPRFAAQREQVQRNRSPCTYAAESRQFDFWIGDWDVEGTQDHSPAGRSHIERTIGDCVIWENWTSLGYSGYFGKSYNAWNPHFARWEQFWVDNGGDLMHFFGKLDQGTMDFWTDVVPQADGTKLRRHLQFIPLPDGSVRQYSRRSVDDGKTWQVEYDFTYRRAAAGGAGASR
jgi:hypothetical protein